MRKTLSSGNNPHMVVTPTGNLLNVLTWCDGKKELLSGADYKVLKNSISIDNWINITFEIIGTNN